MEIENQVNANHPAASPVGENALDNTSAVEQTSAPDQSGASAVSSTDEQNKVHDGDLQQTDPASFAKRIGKIKAKASAEIGALSNQVQMLSAQLQQYQAGMPGAGIQQPVQSGVAQPSPYQQTAQYQANVSPASTVPATEDPVAIFEQLATQAQQRKAMQERAQTQQQVLSKVTAEIEGARDLDPEFDDLMERPPVTNAMVYALNGIENAPAFLKHAIKNNRAELENISRMSEYDQIAVMSRMASQYSQSVKPKVTPAKAPAPVEQTRGANGQFAPKTNELRGDSLARMLMPEHQHFKRS